MEKKLSCKECGTSLDAEKIGKSGLCPNCIKNLKEVFKLSPEKIIARIHTIQGGEGNTPCFNTGKKVDCGQENCEWQDICDIETVDSTV